MAEGNADAPKERVSDLGPRLLYHGTGLQQGEWLMAEHGLLANTPTLTPSLELAQDFVSPARSLLTFWYPKRLEIKRPHDSVTTPTTPISDELRHDITEDLKTSDQSDIMKDVMQGILNKAKTYLPGARLGAVADVDSTDVGWLSVTLPSYEADILTKYSQEKPELINELKDQLEQFNIRYYDPSLTSTQLAEDMAKSSLEHFMLGIGRHIKYAKEDQRPNSSSKAEIVNDLEALQAVEFQEPVYERYRTMLISSIQNTLGTR